MQREKLLMIIAIIVVTLIFLYIAVKRQYIKGNVVRNRIVNDACPETSVEPTRKIFKGILYLRIRRCLKEFFYGKGPGEVKKILRSYQYDPVYKKANIIHNRIYEVYFNDTNKTYIIVEYSRELFVEDIYYGE